MISWPAAKGTNGSSEQLMAIDMPSLTWRSMAARIVVSFGNAAPA